MSTQSARYQVAYPDQASELARSGLATSGGAHGDRHQSYQRVLVEPDAERACSVARE